ncbi:MAG: glutathione peroxidase [bacterium]
MKELLNRLRIGVLLVLMAFSGIASGDCPEWLNHSVKRLHSSESVNLCEEFADKPLLIVNTASHCGFTPQFTALEAMYQEYGEKGIGFLGVPSNSFFQEASSEEKAADVCFVNYGVSFTMLSPIDVTGRDAHPLFKALAQQSSAPKWNFYKYVVDRNGRVKGRFSSMVKPDDPKITELLDELITQTD